MDQEKNQTNGTLGKGDSEPPSADLLSDLLGPLAIEGPPGTSQSELDVASVVEDVASSANASALVPVEEQTNSVQVLI